LEDTTTCQGWRELAGQLGNVSQACKMMGYGRDSFSRFKELYNKGGKPTASSRASIRVCGAQDTFYVGNLKGVGCVHQQTFIHTYAKVGFAKAARS
jgi:Winged helix-turn helix